MEALGAVRGWYGVVPAVFEVAGERAPGRPGEREDGTLGVLGIPYEDEALGRYGSPCRNLDASAALLTAVAALAPTGGQFDAGATLADVHKGEGSGYSQVHTCREGQYLDADVREVRCFDQMLELTACHLRATDLAPEGGFIEDRVHLRWLGQSEDPLPFHRYVDESIDQLRVVREGAFADEGAGVRLGLEETRDQD
jgi:hypothetical protein